MKNKSFLIFFLVIIFPLSFIYGWGEKGHKLINRKAIEILPTEMNFLKVWAGYISEHAADPDTRKKDDSTEWNKHFIDLDFYEEFRKGNMIKDKNQLILKYADSTVSKIGILPWATLETFKNLTQAFKKKDRDKVLIYATDLGHYVSDGHQPLHTIINYNGQLSNQKGIHFRYEVTMFDENIDKMQQNPDSCYLKYIVHPLDFIFNYLENSNSLAPLLFEADKYAFDIAGSRESENYYKLFWFRTKYVTNIQVQSAEENIASLIYTAWINAGKPVFEK